MTKQELEHRDLNNLLDRLLECQQAINTSANRNEGQFKRRLLYHAGCLSLIRAKLVADIHIYTTNTTQP